MSRAALLFVLLVFSAHVDAQEVCGQPSAYGVTAFKNGFEGSASIPSAKATALVSEFAPVKYSAKGLATPTITITYPVASATSSAAAVDVVGTYSGDPNTGITVNGVRAYLHSGQFLAPSVPLASGANSLQAVAKGLGGQSASTSVAVTRAGSPALELQANVQQGLAPFRVRFTTNAPAIPGAVEAVAVDFNGDGTADFTSATLGTLPTYRYAAPGLYIAQITVTSGGGQTTTAQRRILIADVAEHRSRLCTVFAHLRQGLAADSVPSATLALNPQIRTRFTTFFNGVANRPAAAAALGTITNGLVGLDEARLDITRSQGPDLFVYGVHLAPDADGVWRISQM